MTTTQPNHGHGTTLQIGSVTDMIDKQTNTTHQVTIIQRRIVDWLAQDATGQTFVLFAK